MTHPQPRRPAAAAAASGFTCFTCCGGLGFRARPRHQLVRGQPLQHLLVPAAPRQRHGRGARWLRRRPLGTGAGLQQLPSCAAPAGVSQTASITQQFGAPRCERWHHRGRQRGAGAGGPPTHGGVTSRARKVQRGPAARCLGRVYARRLGRPPREQPPHTLRVPPLRPPARTQDDEMCQRRRRPRQAGAAPGHHHRQPTAERGLRRAQPTSRTAAASISPLRDLPLSSALAPPNTSPPMLSPASSLPRPSSASCNACAAPSCSTNAQTDGSSAADSRTGAALARGAETPAHQPEPIPLQLPAAGCRLGAGVDIGPLVETAGL
jgi:hypothetical protein